MFKSIQLELSCYYAIVLYNYILRSITYSLSWRKKRIIPKDYSSFQHNKGS